MTNHPNRTHSAANIARACELVAAAGYSGDDLTGFAEACYDQNSLGELIAALERQNADKGDCETWGLSASEWRTAIGEALAAKLADIDNRS